MTLSEWDLAEFVGPFTSIGWYEGRCRGYVTHWNTWLHYASN